MEMFTPTLDWGNELGTSLVWIAKGWFIAAVSTLVILVVLAQFTSWGRQYWRITRDYFTGRDSVIVWPHDKKRIEAIRSNDARTGQHTQRNGQVECRTFLANVGRSKVDDRFESREPVAGVFDSGFNTGQAFAYGTVGKPDDVDAQLVGVAQ